MPTELARVPIDWKSLFERMNMGFSVQKLIWDDLGNPVDIEYIDVNPSFESITGLSRDKAVGHRTSELIPNLERIVYEHYGKVVRTGESMTFEQYVEGLKVFFKVYAFKTGEDEFGTIFEDITKTLVERENRIKETLLLTTLIDSMTDFIFYKDRQGVYLVCNDNFARKFAGLTKNSVIGKTDEELFKINDPKKLSFILSKDQEVYTTGEVVVTDWDTHLADGKAVRLETIKTPFRDIRGEIVGIVGVSRDVTERRQYEASLDKRMKELEFLNRLMVDRELKMIDLKKRIEALSNGVINN